jgi:hypothetical protein
VKVGDSFCRLRRGSKDGPLVGLQDGQPMRQALCMVGSRLNSDPELGAEERGTMVINLASGPVEQGGNRS